MAIARLRHKREEFSEPTDANALIRRRIDLRDDRPPSFEPAARTYSRIRLILCADDYAIAPGISRGILRLLQARRISAVSCMVTGRHWPEHAGWLRPFADGADIGL